MAMQEIAKATGRMRGAFARRAQPVMPDDTAAPGVTRAIDEPVDAKAS